MTQDVYADSNIETGSRLYWPREHIRRKMDNRATARQFSQTKIFL